MQVRGGPERASAADTRRRARGGSSGGSSATETGEGEEPGGADSGEEESRSVLEVLLFVPNLIDAARLGLVLVAFQKSVFVDQPQLFFGLYLTQALLDQVDGWAARVLGQQSAFGAWFDVVVDNTARSLLWPRVASFGSWISALEWTCFSATVGHGLGWKEPPIKRPRLISAIMANGFYTSLGVWTIIGLQYLPLILYVAQQPALAAVPSALDEWAGFRSGVTLDVVMAFFVAGRLLAALAELWFITMHIVKLCKRNSQRA